ncbi:AraC family transcriptional regulato [Halomicronema hongdechloris C2206]|uniref:AraC family transcriptional regulato n=1 Tax=Halomicronema hongdechloris C2206 TaxID=1641165 RepID=A0A1Z3HQQ7_9CYAN|nr:AraC family transcriptional regulator [Halomicronema hongdechloris]ASC72643.1 AraC family transcriptional regulato [Halomicronema hongdechloris C2206]
MTTLNLALSADTIPTMLRALQQQTGGRYQVDSDEMSWKLQQPFGFWQSRCIQVRDGLDLVLTRADLQQDVTFVETIKQMSTWGLRFCLAGRSLQRLRGHSTDIALRPGTNLIGFMSGTIETTTHYAANQVVELLTVGIQAHVFDALIAPHQAPLNFGQTLALQTPESEMRVTANQTTPAMLTALHKIMNCPYQGDLKRLYLESKILELIVLKLAQVQQGTPPPKLELRLKAEDIERLYRARDILIGNLECPPSLKALAQQTEMNDFKLKRGFRQVFGTTVFGYLHQCRMEKAQWLLEQGIDSVAQVAQAVGYASPSQFSAAFKRKFGVTPRAYKSL